jgi:hypothetical protein
VDSYRPQKFSPPRLTSQDSGFYSGCQNHVPYRTQLGGFSSVGWIKRSGSTVPNGQRFSGSATLDLPCRDLQTLSAHVAVKDDDKTISGIKWDAPGKAGVWSEFQNMFDSAPVSFPGITGF